MREHQLQVTRTARYYTLGDPADAQEVWIVCHGYAQLARYFLRAFAPLDDGTRLIVAPEALNRYYFESAPGEHAHDARVAATWMTKEHREAEIADYVAYLDALGDAGAIGAIGTAGTAGTAKRRVVAFGFSQGASTVSRWAALGQTRIDHVVLWGASLAHELEPAPSLLRGASLTIAMGAADPHVSEERIAREDARLRAAGMDYRLVRYAGGHRIEPDGLLEVARFT
jgi:dienelactone hydrolase